MDILNDYAAVISGNVDGIGIAERLKQEGILNVSSYLTLKHIDDTEIQTREFVEMLLGQRNVKGIARLFGIIFDEYPSLVSMIPELSCGERFTLYLGDDVFLKVLVNDGSVTVCIMRLEV